MKKCGQIFELELTNATSEGEMIEIMHKMTHKKVKAEDKWGAIPMSENMVLPVRSSAEEENFLKNNF